MSTNPYKKASNYSDYEERIPKRRQSVRPSSKRSVEDNQKKARQNPKQQRETIPVKSFLGYALGYRMQDVAFSLIFVVISVITACLLAFFAKKMVLASFKEFYFILICLATILGSILLFSRFLYKIALEFEEQGGSKISRRFFGFIQFITLFFLSGLIILCVVLGAALFVMSKN